MKQSYLYFISSLPFWYFRLLFAKKFSDRHVEYSNINTDTLFEQNGIDISDTSKNIEEASELGLCRETLAFH